MLEYERAPKPAPEPATPPAPAGPSVEDIAAQKDAEIAALKAEIGQ